MKYRRLKTLDSTGVPIMRYYKLADGETPPYCNCFYKIANDEATKIEGAKTGAELVGFSHGGNNLGKGLILLDINETPLYMGILEEADTQRPAIGDLVNGYQRVIDTHYDGDEGVDGKNDYGWGVETMDNPYYVFHIEQNMAESETETVDDEGAGEISPSGGSMEEVITTRKVKVTFNAKGGNVMAPPDNPGTWTIEFKKGNNLGAELAAVLDPYYDEIGFSRDVSEYGPGCTYTVEGEPQTGFFWFADDIPYDPEYHDDPGNKFIIDQPINEDITLYAAWDM